MFVMAEVCVAAAREPCYLLKLHTSAGKETPQRNRKESEMEGYFPTGRVKGQTVYLENDGFVAYRAEERRKKPNKCSVFVVTLCEFIEEWLDENISEPETFSMEEPL